MTENRLISLRSNFHLIDNNISHDTTDKCIKFQIIYDAINKTISSINKESNHSVNNQIIPFTN